MKKMTKQQPMNVHVKVGFTCGRCGRDIQQSVSAYEMKVSTSEIFGDDIDVDLQCPFCKREWRVTL